MDVNSILTKTIASLAQSQSSSVHATGEVHIEHKASSVESGTEATAEQIQGVLDTLNKAASSVDKRVSFSYNDKVDRIIMKMVDPDTDETVQQIPSQDMIKLLERINDMTGTFIDEVG